MKSEHEARVRDAMSAEDSKRRDQEERVLASVIVWEEKLGTSEWESMSAQMSLPIPMISSERYKRLIDLGRWLLAKDWPPRMPKVAQAFTNHRRVISDLLKFFGQGGVEFDENRDRWVVQREYKRIGSWDPPEYDRRFRTFQMDRGVFWWLTIELTRSANWVIRAVVEEVDEYYRFDSGVLLMRMTDGLLTDLYSRVEYENAKWGGGDPYLGLEIGRELISDIVGPVGAADEPTHEELLEIWDRPSD